MYQSCRPPEVLFFFGKKKGAAPRGFGAGGGGGAGRGGGRGGIEQGRAQDALGVGSDKTLAGGLKKKKKRKAGDGA
jgi:hypothetical protein